MSEKILLIDGHSIMNRSFYGLPDLTNAEGVHTGAVYGFLSTMFKLMEDEKPDYLTVAFDVHAKTFRHEVYSEYKAGRSPMPDELRQQIPLIKEVLTAMNIPIMELPGAEADDLLGTVARMAESKNIDATILSGDRDLLQIASKTTKIAVPKTIKGKTIIENYYADDVLEKYKVTPSQYIELKALKGDSSDNIKGLPGVGEKTAEDLMVQFGSIEGIYNNIENIKKKSVRESVAENRELLNLCLFLVTIKTDVSFDFNFDDARIENLYNEDAYNLFKRLELKNFLERFDDSAAKEVSLAESFSIISDDKEVAQLLKLLKSSDRAGLFINAVENDGGFTDSDGQMSLFEINDNKSVMSFAVAVSEDQIFYADSKRLSFDTVNTIIKEIFSNKAVYVYDAKKIYRYIGRDNLSANEAVAGIYDLMIAEYLLNPVKSEYDIESTARERLKCNIKSYRELFDKKDWESAMADSFDVYAKYMAKGAACLLLSADIITDELKNQNMYDLFINMEMPLSFVLYKMECEGILVDRDALKQYGDKLSEGIKVLEGKIYEAAGKEFNISSPKQLAVILFEDMKIPGGKKTKTGYSTSADVLEKLALEYPFVNDILEYRTLTKLKSTYADGLQNFINDDGRIRSTFNQTITATGRISSTEPNLQNIPMRMELGRSIRKVFIPKEDFCFVDADYSQIELRILASMSSDDELIEAYKSGNDIHAITASKVFHVPLDEVTDLQRRNAKAVNFGIVYGISSFGLGADLSISREEASNYIKDYFKSYTGIKTFLDNAKDFAKKNGYSVTLYNRRRPIPEISSSNFMQRGFGERVAMNAPIQGTAADIMKIAMINVYNRLISENLESRIILQVHDELVIEAKNSERELVEKIITEEMMNAADLKVKLEVSCHSGTDWYEAK